MEDRSSQKLSRKGVWQTYTTAHGLGGLRVEHIAEDAEGYLWFATISNGVSRFDGNEFVNFTTKDGLCNNKVFSIYLDSQERLWFGTDEGACWYDGRSFHCFSEDDVLSQDWISLFSKTAEDISGSLGTR